MKASLAVALLVGPVLLPGCGEDSADTQSSDSEIVQVITKSPALTEDGTEVGKIQAYLDSLAPPDAIISTTELHGEVVECIDFYAQPGVKALLEQGVAPADLQKAPPPAPEPMKPVDGAELSDGPILKEPCPDGSIPLRRPTVEEIMSFGGLEEYLKKAPPAINTYEYAVAHQFQNNWGTGTMLNIWNPAQVTASGDHSISQIWAVAGSGSSTQTVEAGWVKRPGSSSRLFIFFTANNYGPGSCWNTDCGFVQTSSSITLNATWSTYSVSGGTQYEDPYWIQKFGTAGDWWFFFRNTWVGYWPRSLFGSGTMASNAQRLDWGGEIYDAAGSSHTLSDMGGDGSFFSSGFGHAAYQRNIVYYPFNGGTWLDANPGSQTVSNAWCYNMGIQWSSSMLRHIYFGGPGYSSGLCPL